MSAATAAPLQHDFRVISLIGVAHGVSHYYQLAFATMLLIVRQEVGLSYADVGLLAGMFYGVSGVAQTAAGFAVDRFGARPILAGGLFVVGLGLACHLVRAFVRGLRLHRGDRGPRQLGLSSRRFRAAQFIGEPEPASAGPSASMASADRWAGRPRR